MAFDRVMFGIGTANLGSRKNKYAPAVQEARFLEILDLGINRIDTADSYSSSNSEKFLSKILKLRPDTLVTTKVGGFFSKLPKPANEIVTNSRVYQKFNIIYNRGYSDFNPRIKPSSLETHLVKSLRRLKVNQVNCYLLHGVPKKEFVDDFIESLLILKDKGLTSSIGISIDKKIQMDLSWCDEVLIPAHHLDIYDSISARLSLHGIFTSQKEINTSIAKKFLSLPNSNSIILGSLNPFVYTEAEKILNGI